MEEVTKSNLGRRVKTLYYTGKIIGGNTAYYLINRDDVAGWELSSLHKDSKLSFGSFAPKNNWWLDIEVEFLDQPKESPLVPPFKFNIGDAVVLNNRGHQSSAPKMHTGRYTGCKSDNAFTFKSGAKIIKREFYPKEGRNWYQIEHNGETYDNWISEDGLELFIAPTNRPEESSYTYKVGDVIRFRNTPNTRMYMGGASIGKTYMIIGKEGSDGVRGINAVEAGIGDSWTSDGNEWGTNFREGDIELVYKVKYDTWQGGVVSTKKPTIARLMLSEELPSNMYKELLTPEEVLERYGVDMKPSSTDIVYINKQKTKHKLLTF